MPNTSSFTLADVRNRNNAAFDAAIKLAFRQAAVDVGNQVAIQALCTPRAAE